MKLLNQKSFTLLFIIYLMFACTQNNKVTDTEADVAAIKELYDAYIQNINTNDFDQWITAWDDNAIRMEPGSPVIVGKDKIAAQVKPLFDNLELTMVLHGEAKIEVYGDRASGYGTITLKSTPKAGGDTAQSDIKWLDVLKKQADGSWKIYIDCINYHPSWSNETSPGDLEEGQKQANPY